MPTTSNPKENKMARRTNATRLIMQRAQGYGKYPNYDPFKRKGMPTGSTWGQTYKQQRAWAIMLDSRAYPDSHKVRAGH